MPVLIGCFVPTKGAMKKETRHNYTRTIDAPNRKAAGAILTAQFYSDHADKADDYFDVKLCDDRIGLSRPAPGEWDTTFTWNKNTGEIEPISPPSETPEAEDPVDPTSNLKSVIKMPTNFRAAVLALFGPVESITKAEYNQILDLVNDDGTSFARELAEAISRSARVLALSAERQTELLDAVRAGVKQNGQWTDFKKFIDKWLDTPAEQRNSAFNTNTHQSVPDAEPRNAEGQKLLTPSGATAGGNNLTDRGVGFVMTEDILALEVSLGIVGRAMDFDIYNLSSGVVNRAREIIREKEKPFPQWFEAWRHMPGGLDYSRAAIICSVKCAPENIELRPGALLTYLNSTLTETDHEHPDATIVAAACGIKSQDAIEDEATIVNNKPTSEIKSGRSVFSINEILAGPDDTRSMMKDREIEICHPINALLSGYTNVMGKEEADGVVTCTGHLISEILPLLLADITATEFCLSPEFSEEEIHHVATSILDAWSDNEAKRQIVALDAITELRAELPAPVVIEKPVIKMKPHPETEEIHAQAVHPTTSPGLTYRQQLTIAAIQGLCANPACFGVFDEIAEMAITLANATDRDND
ncbi:hypothetical protein GJV07_02015 [Enterobacteriaceae bacterium RIT711]|nr:hypothetical protein [Enterobacteriaceae bacterium RIT711]